MSIDIAVTPHPTVTVVAVAGDIDMQTAPQLEGVLSDITGHVVIDLSGTTFLDSTALGVFVGTDNRLRPGSHTLSFVCPDPRLQKIFRITRLDALWPIHDALDLAVPPAAGGRPPV